MGTQNAPSEMPNAMAPINVEGLDRRVMELRAVEQWHKLNLKQSTIQAFELQRAAAATEDAFSTFFVQQSMLLQPFPADTPEGLYDLKAGMRRLVRTRRLRGSHRFPARSDIRKSMVGCQCNRFLLRRQRRSGLGENPFWKPWSTYA
jgi:hypothetical protein